MLKLQQGQHFDTIHWQEQCVSLKLWPQLQLENICKSVLTPSTAGSLLGCQKPQTTSLLPKMQPCGWKTSKPLAIVRDKTHGAQFSASV